jgi:hypothetical protein
VNEYHPGDLYQLMGTDGNPVLMLILEVNPARLRIMLIPSGEEKSLYRGKVLDERLKKVS